MLNKTIITLGVIASSFSFAGAYVGASIGPEGASFSQNSHVRSENTQGSAIEYFDAVDREHYSGTGFFGSIFAGYSWLIKKNYFFAAELNANLSAVEYKLVNDEFIHSTFSKTTFTIKNSEGISFLPGYYFSPNTLGYLRVGYTNGHLKINESDNTIYNFNNHINGIRYGLGMRHSFAQNWELMLDYSQINYSSVKSQVFEPVGMVRKQSKISSNTAQVGFGLIYHFS